MHCTKLFNIFCILFYLKIKKLNIFPFSNTLSNPLLYLIEYAVIKVIRRVIYVSENIYKIELREQNDPLINCLADGIVRIFNFELKSE